ncbi:hypothetical protein [Nocardia africana]|uniref:DUF4282 domain-containing protein n=1 Tax=Nocardia africana TaxID=134964 RepID=A0A378WQE2_9NOCA|nr:hypothetical protein [Nocardia africana]MCC3314891.1 hypothetical protein [Nocardia africana]SUA42825.1 Uncharacterised protein [Nocardia africana]
MKRSDIDRLLVTLRPLRIPLILVVLYLALRAVMAALSARHGYGSPDGLGFGYLAVTAAVVVLRLALLTIVPAVLVYRLVVFVLTRLPGRGGAGGQESQFIEKPSVETVNPFAEASSLHDTPESRAVQVKPSADRDVL